MGEMKQPEGENPVVSAAQTLMQYVTAAEKRGDPRAMEMKSALQHFVQAVTGAQKQEGEMPKAPMPQSPQMPQMPQEDSEPAFDPFKAEDEEEEMAMPRSKKNRNKTVQPLV